MKRLFALFALVSGLAIPLGIHTHTTAARVDAKALSDNFCPPPPKKCPHPPPPKSCPNPYKCTTGTSVTASGTFQLQVSKTRVRLIGSGSRSTAGTPIYASKVAAAHVPANGVAFKLFASRDFPELRLVGKGSLFWLSLSTGKWTAIKAIGATGIYAAVLK